MKSISVFSLWIAVFPFFAATAWAVSPLSPKTPASAQLFYSTPPGTIFFNTVRIEKYQRGSYRQPDGQPHGLCGVVLSGQAGKLGTPCDIQRLDQKFCTPDEPWEEQKDMDGNVIGNQFSLQNSGNTRMYNTSGKNLTISGTVNRLPGVLNKIWTVALQGRKNGPH